MSSHSFLIDPGLLMAYGNVQYTYIENIDISKQSPSVNCSYDNDPFVHFPQLNSSKTDSTSNSDSNLSQNSLNPPHFCDSVSAEKITAKSNKFEDTLDVQLVENPLVTFSTHVEEHFEGTTAQSDELKDFDDITVVSIPESDENGTQQQSPTLDFNIAESEVRNPLFTLLHNSGSHLRKLIHNIHRNDLVPVRPDINLIGKVIANHLLDLATPPQRKVPTSTLITWTKYFKDRFPKTPTSAFYAFKYEPYKRKDGILLQRKRAEGVLQVQLFQERRKLIKENRDILLRHPNIVSTDKNRDPCSSNDIYNITTTWRSVSQSEGEIQSSIEIPRKVSVIEADPTIETHLLYLRQQLHYKLTPQLAASWEATFQYRRKQLTDQPGTVWDYLNEYKFLQIEEIGKALIEQDFDKLYPDLDPITKYSGNLAKNCENHRHAIIAAALVVLKKTSQQKHKDIATSFFELAKQDSNVTLRVTGALLLLPFIFPYVHVHKTWKPTRVDIVESFIARVYSETEVEEHIERRRKSRIEIAKSAKICTSLQPYVLAIGPTWDNISHSHIIVDKVLYTCKNIIEAAELCFKLFHVFHSDYPPESKHVWQFIQQGFYKLFIKDHDINRRTIMKALADIGIYIEEKEVTPLRKKTKKL
ncbi:uncharacterized protein LOC116853148 isoform X2 [Odontomachus brunneus]|nr:uncharacterized protein LOC116853148 isoform X2 [Odontomachus brunneus]